MSWKGWGKPWRNGKAAEGRSSSASYHSSSYVPGQETWVEPWQGYKQNAKKEDVKSLFPAYKQQPQTDIQVIAEQCHASKTLDSEEDIVKEIQRAINAARKAEQKVTKLQSELQKGQAQWKSYEQAIKQAYVKERAQFQSDQQKLKHDLAEALTAQASTRRALRTAATGQTQEVGTEHIDMDIEQDAGWQALMLDTALAESSETKQELDGWMQQELISVSGPDAATIAKARIAAAAKAPNGTGDHAGQMTPPRPTQQGMPSPTVVTRDGLAGSRPAVYKAMQPFGGAAGYGSKGDLLTMNKATHYRCGSQAFADPYMMSASLSGGPAPEGGHVSTPPSAKNRRSPRTSIKELAKPKGPVSQQSQAGKVSLADKLMAQRLAAAGGEHAAKDGEGRSSAVLVDDDNEDHVNVPIPSGSELEQLDG